MTRTRSELYAPDEVVAVMKRAYYAVLAEHAPFADELAALPARAGIRRKAVHDVVRRFEHRRFTEGEFTAALWETVSRAAEEKALRFARKWKMPANSHDEVIDAILLSFAIGPEVKAEAGLGEGPAPWLPLVPDSYLRSRAWRERPIIDLGVEKRVTVALSVSYRPWQRTPKQMQSHRPFTDAAPRWR